MTFILFATSGLQTSANIRARHTFVCLMSATWLPARIRQLSSPKDKGLTLRLTPEQPGDGLAYKEANQFPNKRTERNETERKTERESGWLERLLLRVNCQGRAASLSLLMLFMLALFPSSLSLSHSLYLPISLCLSCLAALLNCAVNDPNLMSSPFDCLSKWVWTGSQVVQNVVLCKHTDIQGLRYIYNV